MKKNFAFIILFFLTLVLGNIEVCSIVYGKSIETANNKQEKWAENDFRFSIYTSYRKVESVSINDIYSFEPPDANSINIILINGGTVAYDDIIIENDRILARPIILEYIGANVELDSEKGIYSVNYNNRTVTFEVGSLHMGFGENSVTIDTPPRIIDGEVYVPIRSLTELLGAEVQFVADYSKTLCANNFEYLDKTINIVTIEFPKPDNVYSADEGLAIVKSKSIEKYDNIKELLSIRNSDFNDKSPDFNPLDISYVDVNFGRYYIYCLESYSMFPIYFNKYNGEVYSGMAGLPDISVHKGFVNLNFLY